MNDRAAAWGLLTEFTQSESLRKHGLAVEACMRAYARKFASDSPEKNQSADCKGQGGGGVGGMDAKASEAVSPPCVCREDRCCVFGA